MRPKSWLAPLVLAILLALPGVANAGSFQSQLSTAATLVTYQGETEFVLNGGEVAFDIYRNDILVGGFQNPPTGEVWNILPTDPGDKVKLCEDADYLRHPRFTGFVLMNADTEGCIEQMMGEGSPPFHFVYRKEETVYPYFLPGSQKAVWVTPGRCTRMRVWLEGNLVDSVTAKILSKHNFLRLQNRGTSHFYRNPVLADFGPPNAATWLRGELHETPEPNFRSVWIRWCVSPRAWHLRHGARIGFRLGMLAEGAAIHPDLTTEEWESFKTRRYYFRVR